MRAYTRALDLTDYADLAPWVRELAEFEDLLRSRGIPYRKDHEHRSWEYACILRQLRELVVTENPPSILDTGSGGSYFPLYLAYRGEHITVTDSMAYGDIREAFIEPQARGLNVPLPCYAEPVEQMNFPDNTFDVTMCISVIEHVEARLYERALRSLCRVTKPGGYLFLTSDYFRDVEQADQSIFRSIQHTIFTEPKVYEIPSIIPVTFVGGMDLTYKGDFVNNYSFCNICLQKTASGHFE